MFLIEPVVNFIMFQEQVL